MRACHGLETPTQKRTAWAPGRGPASEPGARTSPRSARRRRCEGRAAALVESGRVRVRDPVADTGARAVRAGADLFLVLQPETRAGAGRSQPGAKAFRRLDQQVHRHGPTGMVRLRRDPETGRFGKPGKPSDHTGPGASPLPGLRAFGRPVRGVADHVSSRSRGSPAAIRLVAGRSPINRERGGTPPHCAQQGDPARQWPGPRSDTDRAEGCTCTSASARSPFEPISLEVAPRQRSFRSE